MRPDWAGFRRKNREMRSLLAVDFPVWALAGLIFAARVVDVSLGTMRTIMVVNGRLRLSVVLGFLEVLVWLMAVSQVILRLHEHPVLVLAYATGFATGNAVGILLERRIAFGQCVVRMISTEGQAIARALDSLGKVLGVFHSEVNGSPSQLVFATLARRNLPEAVRKAKRIDPEIFYVVDRFAETSHLTPLPHPSGWRTVLKKK
jgi:uncharacterized protein YebE (UPF0316 family)